MANATLFVSALGPRVPAADARNEAGGRAYRFDDRHALARYAATGCLHATFYASAETQLAEVLGLSARVEPEFIARTAIFAREKGFMKDMPALLCAVLSARAPHLLAAVFDRVIDTPRMLRTFVQIMRSGAVGRCSLGSGPKRLVRRWLDTARDEQIIAGSVGRHPSLADVIRMVHPAPRSASREALYGYLLGRPCDESVLPEVVRAYEQFKRSPGETPVPHVPFQMLASLPLRDLDWAEIARRASWQTTRMNLNTFLRHGVFGIEGMTELIARRLAERRLVRGARAFPYQLMVAYLSASRALPAPVRDALHDALEIAVENVPHIEGKVYVCLDVSGSMHSPLTGDRPGATTAVRCIDVAALIAAAILRANPDAEILPFQSDVIPAHLVEIDHRDSVMTNARRLAALPAGGTNCSAPLCALNRRHATGDLVIYVSDNESWIDSLYSYQFSNGTTATATMEAWAQFKARNPRARMICIDIQPHATTQAKERPDIVNVGGFSDQVFELIADVARGGTDRGYWTRKIERIDLSTE